MGVLDFFKRPRPSQEFLDAADQYKEASLTVLKTFSAFALYSVGKEMGDDNNPVDTDLEPSPIPFDLIAGPLIEVLDTAQNRFEDVALKEDIALDNSGQEVFYPVFNKVRKIAAESYMPV